jgi:hypothetical protein
MWLLPARGAASKVKQVDGKTHPTVTKKHRKRYINTRKVLTHARKDPAGRRYSPMGYSGDHRSPGYGFHVLLRLETLGLCTLPDEIPSPAASPGSGKLGRRPTQGTLVAMRHIKIKNAEMIPHIARYANIYYQPILSVHTPTNLTSEHPTTWRHTFTKWNLQALALCGDTSPCPTLAPYHLTLSYPLILHPL